MKTDISGANWVDIGNSNVLHRELVRGKSMADNGAQRTMAGPARVILNRRSFANISLESKL